MSYKKAVKVEYLLKKPIETVIKHKRPGADYINENSYDIDIVGVKPYGDWVRVSFYNPRNFEAEIVLKVPKDEFKGLVDKFNHFIKENDLV